MKIDSMFSIQCLRTFYDDTIQKMVQKWLSQCPLPGEHPNCELGPDGYGQKHIYES